MIAFLYSSKDVLIATQSLDKPVFEFVLLYYYQIKVPLGEKKKMDGVHMAEVALKT
jgi:hypothetical protein